MILEINKDNSPRPDGFNAKFIQYFWVEIKEDTMRFVKEFFDNDFLDPKVTWTIIALIQKNLGAMHIADFHPICLCKVHYKIILKIMVGRMMPLLHRFISNNQGAFMPGRKANDNVVIAKEMVHMMSQKHRKRHICALKLDVHKAYNTISWNFLKTCLLNLGFSSQFFTRIMNCVSSISFHVTVNGTYSDVSVPPHGLR